MATNHTVSIGLLGPFGGGNLGDAAIQQSVIERIKRQYPSPKIYGFSMYPEDTEKRHGIASFPIGRSWSEQRSALQRAADRLSFWVSQQPVRPLRRLDRWVARVPQEVTLYQQARKNLAGLDALFISGGGQLDDYFGGPFSHPYTLWKFTHLARSNGVKVFFISVGAGPLDHPLSIRLVRRALSLANYRSFRDQRSRDYMAERGFYRADPVFPDLAHSLPIDKFLAAVRASHDGQTVGLGPMGYFAPSGWPKSDPAIYDAYLNKLAEFAHWLLERGKRIVLFPGEAVQDRNAILDLLKILETRYAVTLGEQLVLPTILTVDELMSTLVGLDLVVASRFHGVLLSMLFGKPVLALSYHPKIDELMRDTSQEQYCLPIETFGVDDLKRRFVNIEACPESSRSQICNRIGMYRSALEEQYETIFHSL